VKKKFLVDSLSVFKKILVDFNLVLNLSRDLFLDEHHPKGFFEERTLWVKKALVLKNTVLVGRSHEPL